MTINWEAVKEAKGKKTSKQLAMEAGVTAETLSRLKRGFGVRRSTAECLAGALGVPVERILVERPKAGRVYTAREGAKLLRVPTGEIGRLIRSERLVGVAFNGSYRVTGEALRAFLEGGHVRTIEEHAREAAEW